MPTILHTVWNEPERSMQALILPFLYCLLLGSAWSVFFGKKFSNSLAPALMLHMIIVMLCGMVFHKLSVGIYGGMAAFAGVLMWRLVQTRPAMKALARMLWNDGAFVFFVLYLFCFFSNYGKRFIGWDEFGHWGMFLKESLRLDMLYAESPLPLFHQDYVPATTLFEVIWCRLSGRFLEADAYRAIQMVMFAMMLPMFNSFAPEPQEGAAGGMWQALKRAFSGRGRQLAAVFFVMLLPLLFRAGDAGFYHSIYIDFFLGVVFFYCGMQVWLDGESKVYQAMVLALGFATLLLTKQTGIILLPLVFVLYVLKLTLFDVRDVGVQSVARLSAIACAVAIAPVLLWYLFTAFVEAHVPSHCAASESAALCSDTGANIQSYSGFRSERVLEALKSPKHSSIVRLKEFQETFVNAIFFARGILLHGSFIPVAIFISLLVFMLAHAQKDTALRRRIRVVGYFIALSALAYIAQMYMLYAVVFPVHEYLLLACYERYMSTFVFAAMLLAVYIYYDSGAWEKHLTGCHVTLVLVFSYLLLFHATSFSQALPGSLTHDRRKVAVCEYAATRIMEVTPEHAKVYIIKRERMWPLFKVALTFYASPRTVHIANIGPSINTKTNNSVDLSPEQLHSVLKNYEYLYFETLDDKFIDKYSVIFGRPELLKNDTLYKITSSEGGVISLE